MSLQTQWTPEQIDAALSDNFSGDEMEVYNNYNDEDVEVFETYTGEDDDLIESFSGKGLHNLEKSTKRFGFTIHNKTNTAKQVVITPGNYPVIRAAAVVDDGNHNPVIKAVGGTMIPAPSGYAIGDVVILYDNPEELIAAGHRIDAVADDGIIYADNSGSISVKAAKQEARFRYFLEFLKKNPTAFAGMHINSDNTEQFETELILRKTSPYKVYGEERIPFQDGFRPSNMNTDKIIVQRQFQLDGETLAIITVPANTATTFTFVAGAVVSQATGLKRKLSHAQKGHRVRRMAIRHRLPYIRHRR